MCGNTFKLKKTTIIKGNCKVCGIMINNKTTYVAAHRVVTNNRIEVVAEHLCILCHKNYCDIMNTHEDRSNTKQ